jgi:uncharacterized delta-60 repeat protein
MALQHRLLFISLPLALVAAAYGCVGDSSVGSGPTDAGQDSSVPDAGGGSDAQGMNMSDASDATTTATDGATDSGADAGKQCIYVTDAGASGTLDQSFSNATHPEVLYSAGADVDAQGNIYVVGHVNNCIDATSHFDIAIYKFLPTGAADTGFGQSGKICLGVPYDGVVGDERGRALRVDPSGNIVVVGGTGSGGWNSAKILVARVKPAGTLDTTFGTNGIYTASIAGLTNNFPVAYGVAFDQSVSPPKIVVAGSDGDEFKQDVGGILLRLNSTGVADNGFNGGAPIVDLNATAFYGVAVDGSGNVFVTGSTKQTAPPARDMIVSKYTVSGAAAAGFGVGGKVAFPQLSTNNFSEGRSIIALSNGKLVVTALGESEGGTLFTVGITSTGALDTTFASQESTKGVLRLPALAESSDYQFEAMRQRCDGRYLVFGYETSLQAVARVAPAGALEAFGDAGLAVSATPNSAPLAAVEDPTTGRIVLVGRDGTGQLLLERYQP